MERVKTYRQLFAIREFRVLFLVQCLNIGSYAVASLALGTITFAATGSPVLTALAMFGAPLMRLVGQTLFGSGSDLVRPRTALVLVVAHDDGHRPAAGDPGARRGDGASRCSRSARSSPRPSAAA